MNPDENAGGGVALGTRRERHAVSATLAGLGPWFAQSALPFLLIAYLGFRGGGYDEIVRGEVGIAAWWVVVVGAAAGILPLRQINWAGWATLGVFSLFAAWTALGIGWSESAEQSVAELGRVASLLAIFSLALSLQGPESLRRMVGGVAAGIGLVSAAALLSWLHPAWFAAPETVAGLDATRNRLHYPLDYWNGLGAFAAIGLPLLVAGAATARTVIARALFAAAVPAVALAGFFTLSRGAGFEAAIAFLALFALYPRRLALLAPALVTGAGAAILIAAATQREDLMDGLSTAARTSQGDEMLAMALVVCAGVALLSVAMTLAERHEVGPRFRVSAGRTRATGALVAVVAVIAAVAAGLPGTVSDSWEEFKNPVSPAAGAERFDSAAGSGRYQFWETAVDAAKTEPVVGIGPGTFEYFWAREGSLPTFIRDAHSLYLETAAELGLIGLALIVALIAAPFVAGIGRTRMAGAEDRAWIAAAVGGCAAFAVAAAIDWAWELTVLPVAFLLLTAAILGRPRSPDSGRGSGSNRNPRLALGGLAVAGLIAIAIPMASASAIRDSQAEVRAQDLPAALDQAHSALDIQPYAATASLQEALVLELQGDLEAARLAAVEATQDEPTNWRTWLVLSRLEAKLGNAEASVDSYREARSLNPRSVLFQ
jgi:hypothetical protein